MTQSDFERLVAEHGGDAIPTRPGGSDFLLPDGSRVVDGSFGGRFEPPPDDRWERLHARREFVVLKLDYETKAFETAKKRLSEQADFARRFNSPPPVDQQLNDLRRGRDRIIKLRETLVKIDLELNDSPEAKLQREREAELAAHVEAMNDYINSIESITI